jgi:hypothetical protein
MASKPAAKAKPSAAPKAPAIRPAKPALTAAKKSAPKAAPKKVAETVTLMAYGRGGEAGGKASPGERGDREERSPRRRTNQMVNRWWLAVEALGMLFLMIPGWRAAYCFGIRDGAFNHHLPIVRREMLLYDERRAQAIFEEEDASLSGPPGALPPSLTQHPQ